ncbi:MAG: hypothetical protein J6A01_11150 [Proteobacteria bacterium]|nr:hypothetical protein [Pseudomonadota bacterium]
MHRIPGMTLAVFFVLASAQVAFADPKPAANEPAAEEVTEPVDPCQTLAENTTWNTEVVLLTENVKRKDFDAALLNAEKLTQICDRSPIVNYSIGRIWQEKGDEAKALEFLKRATLHTREFNIPDSNLEKMWYDRYEAEHPDARPENIEARQKEISQLHSDVDAANERTRMVTAERDAKIEEIHRLEKESHDNYGTGLWTGVGIAGAGVVLAAVGGAMMAVKKDEAVDNSKFDVHFDCKTTEETCKPIMTGGFSVKHDYTAYMIMLGAGAGLAVAGSIVAGIMGYKYTHSKDSDETLSFGISPTGAVVNVTF